MNLNDKRLGAYNKILKPGSSPAEPEVRPFSPPRMARTDPAAAAIAAIAGKTGNSKAGNAKTGGAKNESSSAGRTGVAKSAPVDAGRTGSAGRDDLRLPGLVKIPSTSTGGKDSPYRRVAKFLLIIGTEEAAKVLSKLSQEQTEKVVLELASIRRVEKDEAAVVLAEFESLLRQAREPSGGVETARSILEAAFGSERAEAMLGKIVPDFRGKPFDYLADIDPDRLLRILSDELPAVKALVLSQLNPRLAAGVIKLMTDAEKNETVRRLAKLASINPEVLRRVDEGMREKMKNINTAQADSIDGRSALAEILKRMDGSSEKSILAGLTETDPDLGRDLRDRLFTIDDIIHSDDRFMQETLRPMTEHDLAVLVIGKSEEFRNKIFANLSRTRGALVLEEEQIVAPVSRVESEQVTGSFFSVMRRAWENGAFIIDGRDDKEVWVK